MHFFPAHTFTLQFKCVPLKKEKLEFCHLHCVWSQVIMTTTVNCVLQVTCPSTLTEFMSKGESQRRRCCTTVLRRSLNEECSFSLEPIISLSSLSCPASKTNSDGFIRQRRSVSQTAWEGQIYSSSACCRFFVFLKFYCRWSRTRPDKGTGSEEKVGAWGEKGKEAGKGERRMTQQNKIVNAPTGHQIISRVLLKV